MAKWLSVVGLFAVVSGSIVYIYFKRINQKRLQDRRKLSVISGSPVESTVFVDESGDIIGVEHAKALTFVLGNESCNDDFKKRALITVANKAAFTQNHVILRESDCLRALSCLVQSLELRCKAGNDIPSSDLIEAALTAINNLANSEENQCHLQDSIGSLLVFASSHLFLPEKVRVASLRCLVNFTCTDSCIDSFLQFDTQQLFDLTEGRTSNALRIMSLKLLANLSWHKSMTVSLLAATVPSSFFNDLGSSDDIVLRWLTILRNLTMKIDVSQLTVDLCRSGKLTLAEIFCDVSQRKLLVAKLNDLRTHSDDDIKQLSLQLSRNLSGTAAEQNR